MKKIFLFFLCHASVATFAQSPQGIPYQAIARNASGVAIANTAVKVRFSIRDSIATGAIKYQETHNPTTSALGLFSVNVGMGTIVTGTFSGINWGKNAKFLQVELNITGGATYTDLGTTQMMSVPYALYAGSVFGFPTGGTEGQIIANCGGQPTWTNNGICPGRVSSLNCAGVVQTGPAAFSTIPVQISFSLPYSGGNGGPYSALSALSSGVSGLTASLSSGNFNNGSGNLSISISGTATTSGTASFGLNIGGQYCSLNLIVNPVSQNLVSDIDGNVYQTVTIGTQVWFKENLKVSKYKNGDQIPTGFADSQWLNLTSGACAVYNNDQANNLIYGKLYNYYAVADPRGLCPVGWHVPTDIEWTLLENNLGGTAVAGGKLKLTSGWESPNSGANNSSGFSALPGGDRYGYTLNPTVFTGGYKSAGISAVWWSSTGGSTSSRGREINYVSESSFRYSYQNHAGFSVRCIKD
jgi:uncharacterized protein (TIGR02145 family)